MQQVKIYGFGSFFNNKSNFHDIDILILHSNTSIDSCNFAKFCKDFIISNIPQSDITMLSEPEESNNSFIKKSRAYFIGEVLEQSANENLINILSYINNY